MIEQEKLRWAWLQGWKNWTESRRNHNADINPYQFRLFFLSFADGFRAREQAEYLRETYGADTYHFFLGPRMENDTHVSVKEPTRYKTFLDKRRHMVLNSDAAN